MTQFPFVEYFDFYTDYNIKNGFLADQNNLNKTANQLKREVNVLYNIQQIVAGKPGIAWRENLRYLPGEIVTYKGLYYCAKLENINTLPDIIEYWEKVTVADFTQYLTAEGFLSKKNEVEYFPTKPYHPATKKYIDDIITDLKNSDDIFLRLNRPIDKPYTPTLDYHPATKRYVDTRILQMRTDTNLEVQSAKTANGIRIQDKDGLKNIDSSQIFYGINEFEWMKGYYGIYIGGDSNEYIRTTASGFLPYSQDTEKGSTLGNSQWKFAEVWTHRLFADEFYGKTNSESADIAEQYDSDFDYEAGTILGIGGDKEVTKYNPDLPLIGVVSTNPGVRLNSGDKFEIGKYIALKGRTPVKIFGSAEKGDYIDAYLDGFGVASKVKSDKSVGIVLNGGENLVEIFVI